MNTQTITFSFVYIIHSFNGFADIVECNGVIYTENDGNQSLQEETVVSLIRLAQILRPIYMRMLANGYTNSNGKLVKFEQNV